MSILYTAYKPQFVQIHFGKFVFTNKNHNEKILDFLRNNSQAVKWSNDQEQKWQILRKVVLFFLNLYLTFHISNEVKQLALYLMKNKLKTVRHFYVFILRSVR